MLFPATPWAGESCRKGTLPEYGFALVAHVYKSFFADRLVSCYMSCSMQPACQSLNYNLADKTCEFNNDTKYYRPKYFVEKPTFVYAENPDSERPWRRLNSNPVCFGAKDNQYGTFVVEVGGHIDAVKLVHLHGKVSCDVSKGLWSNWGCGSNFLMVLLTNSTNAVLIPKVEEGHHKYKIEGYNSTSPEIIWKNFTTPIGLTSEQELRLWFGQDLLDINEGGNNGTSCTDVFALYL
ncbi:PREDICTED: uncharacterized protein LOC107346208 [Acropora digitifera]|uniref:uncharacterized protein LOC107346208 n=1 Tax=Acropora digitifera TaxID=70779 RepID=UPI00077A13AC|nr:PREDICTED: uncharacterized protein LOC107346208 [Acropora digitifera]